MKTSKNEVIQKAEKVGTILISCLILYKYPGYPDNLTIVILK